MWTDVEQELLALIIGYRIREARLRRNLSQSELAQGIGSQSMISLIESGAQLPPADVLELIARKLDEQSLLDYVGQLQKTRLSLEELVAASPATLLDVLRTRRGRWHDIHGRVALMLCENYYTQRQLETVQEVSELILEHFSSTNPLYAEACFYLGSRHLFEPDFDQAREWLGRAERVSYLLPTDMLGRLHYNLGYLHYALANYGLSLWYAKHAVDTFQRLNDFTRYGKSLGLLGACHGVLNQLDEAKKTMELAYDILRKWGGDAVDLGRVEASLAAIHYRLRRADDAETWADRALHTGEASGDARTVYGSLWVMLSLYQDRRDIANAVKSLRSAIHTAETIGDTELLAQILIKAASLFDAHHDKLAAARRAYEITLDTHWYAEHGLAAELLSNLYEEAGETREAAHYRAAALAAYRRHVLREPSYGQIVE